MPNSDPIKKNHSSPINHGPHSVFPDFIYIFPLCNWMFLDIKQFWTSSVFETKNKNNNYNNNNNKPNKNSHCQPKTNTATSQTNTTNPNQTSTTINNQTSTTTNNQISGSANGRLQKVGVYYGNWDGYGRNFQICNVPGDKLDYLFYSFLDPSTGTCQFSDAFLDLQRPGPIFC